ncbi:MAG: FAD-dependent oxidoreductase, partial [Clostridia bacterium]|nr:FAD-dependent oxidoreductase [Clostridia bacterium]
GQAGADGRTSIVPTGNYQTLACDTVIVATGSKLDTTVLNGTDIKVEKGRVVVDENLNAGGNVFFGGDNVNREGTVVWAVKDGIKASDSITQFLKN